MVFTEQPGRVHEVVHRIHTQLEVVVGMPLCSLPLTLWDMEEKEVEVLLALGVIEESTSPWRSLLVLVPMPDWSVRFCIHFGCLKAVSDYDAYLMPRVDALLDVIREAQYPSHHRPCRTVLANPVSP